MRLKQEDFSIGSLRFKEKKFVQKAKKLEIFASPFPRPLVSPSVQFFDLCGSLSLPLYCEHFQFQLIPF